MGEPNSATTERAGDARTGASGALADVTETQPSVVQRTLNLRRIDSGDLVPNRESRLGAYAATVGYPRGTVGFAVHNAIGAIYLTMGTLGEERIGVVFHSPQARALFNDPVSSPSSLRVASFEHAYWAQVRAEDKYSIGGQLGIRRKGQIFKLIG